MNNTHAVLLAALALQACTQAGGVTETLREVAQDNGWDYLEVVVADTGQMQEPYLKDGVCYIITSYPPPGDLAAGRPEYAPVFSHIGRSLNKCLYDQAYGGEVETWRMNVLFDGPITIGRNESSDICLRDIAGCYVDQYALLVVVPSFVYPYVTDETPYHSWEEFILGHEMWHAVDPTPWHS